MLYDASTQKEGQMRAGFKVWSFCKKPQTPQQKTKQRLQLHTRNVFLRTDHYSYRPSAFSPATFFSQASPSPVLNFCIRIRRTKLIFSAVSGSPHLRVYVLTITKNVGTLQASFQRDLICEEKRKVLEKERSAEGSSMHQETQKTNKGCLF